MIGSFPITLPLSIIKKIKPKLVYDPFLGSGTTCIAANMAAVSSIGVDISPPIIPKFKTKASVTIIKADSRSVKLPQKGIDLIITSPPYIGQINYQDKFVKEEIGSAHLGTSYKARKKYAADMIKVFQNALAYLTPKALAFIIVQDKFRLLDPQASGFRQIHRLTRKVTRVRGIKRGTYFESVLVWQKA